MKLTGNVFESKTQDEFQLEAVVDGHITRLKTKGKLPKDCFTEENHDGFGNYKVLDLDAGSYKMTCTCGNTLYMYDVNSDFEETK